MKVITLAQIEAALDLNDVYDAIRRGFIAFSQGRVQLGAVGYLAFPAVSGECHIKAAAWEEGEVFAVKIASGFVQNAALGLPAANGLIMLFCAQTGRPLVLLMDEGRLTDIRTAVAGALAAKHIMPPNIQRVGIVGTGVQARLQAQMIAKFAGTRKFMICGRNADRAQALAELLRSQQLDVLVASDLPILCAQTELIVTTTPSREPLVRSQDAKLGMRIVAVGADAPGKQEIETSLVASMDVLLADSKGQCLDHGELSHAHQAGLIDSSNMVELGTALANAPKYSASVSILVDLTGLGIQDLCIAQSVWQRMKASNSPAATT